MKRNCTELIRYLFTGGATTVVNYVIYAGLLCIGVHYLIANSLAWCGAVVFAFWANRQFVFQSRGNWKKEFAAFTAARLATLAAENVLLVLLIQGCGMAEFVAKILVSVVTVVLNYVVCKVGIFREAGHE